MFTDIAGYTAMMQENEAHALKIRTRHREVFEATHQKHGGQILQYYGDGTLSIFDSALEAARCAVEMQIAFQEEPVVPLRIGIHTGDIIFDKEEVMGDGVNVASRVESVAVPGSIMISDKVYDYIKNQVEIRTMPMGEFLFKNVDKPLKVYVVANDGLELPDPNKLQGKFVKHTKPGQKNLLERMPGWAKYVAGFALFLVLAPLIYFPLYNTLFSSAANSKTLVDEFGNEMEMMMVDKENIKKFLIAPFRMAHDSLEAGWLRVGIPYALEMDWDQDPYVKCAYDDEAEQKSLNETIEKAKARDMPLLMMGSYDLTEEGYVIKADFYETASSKMLHTFEETGTDLFRTLDRFSLKIKEGLGIPSSHLAMVKDLPIYEFLTNSTEAYQVFSEGFIRSAANIDYRMAKFEKAVRIDPSFAWASYNQAILHHYFQRSALKAKEGIENAMKNRKRLPERFEVEVRQLNYTINDQQDKALQLRKLMVEMDPSNETMLRGLINELVMQYELEEALEQIKNLRDLTDDPQNMVAQEGNIWLRLGKPKKGIKKLEKRLESHPEEEGSIAVLCVLYLATEEWEEAEKLLNRSSVQFPESKVYPRLLEHLEFRADSADYFQEEDYEAIADKYWVEQLSSFQMELSTRNGLVFLKASSQLDLPFFPINKNRFVSTQDLQFILPGNPDSTTFIMLQEMNFPPFPMLRMPDGLQQVLADIKAGKEEGALDALKSWQETFPNHAFIPRLIQYLEHRGSEQWEQSRLLWPNYTQQYQIGRDTLTVFEQNDQLMVQGKVISLFLEETRLYEFEPGQFMHLAGFSNILGFEKGADGTWQMTFLINGDEKIIPPIPE